MPQKSVVVLGTLGAVIRVDEFYWAVVRVKDGNGLPNQFLFHHVFCPPNDQAQLRTNRLTGWPPTAAPCQVAAGADLFGEYVVNTKIACLAIAFCASATIGACRHDSAEKATWIRGDSQERWTTVERHLRGLDIAMVEIGYRYQELYWAGVDSNWEYATYQAKKIGLALENALERRPKRRASAKA